MRVRLKGSIGVAGENAELARKLYRAFSEGDVHTGTELLNPEIQLETPKGTPEEGTYKGYEEVIRHLAGLIEPFADVRVEIEELVEAGDQVIVVVHASGRGRGSGLEIDTRFAHLLTIRGGKVIRLQAFFDKAGALEAAGTS